jgi:hypothetical protein
MRYAKDIERITSGNRRPQGRTPSRRLP